MRGAIHVGKIKMEYVVLLPPGGTQRVHAFRAQVRIELLLIYVESRRKPY
jgi:hypothetical protein